MPAGDWRDQETKICQAANCGVSIQRPDGISPRRWQERQFCSRACSNRRGHTSLWGENNPAWKGEGARKNTKRRRAMRRYSLGDCERCGKPAVDRHHRDGDPGHNEPENVAFLCRRCHLVIDGRMERRAQSFGGTSRRKEECRHGHALTPENVYEYIGPRYTFRRCRICKQAIAARSEQKRREVRNG